jgi:hypothetical protein
VTEAEASKLLGLPKGLHAAGRHGIGSPKEHPKRPGQKSGPLIDAGSVHSQLTLKTHDQRDTKDSGSEPGKRTVVADALNVDEFRT